MFDFMKNLFRSGAAGPSADKSSLRTALSRHEQAETGLRQSEEHFAQLVAGVRDYAVFLLDRQGNVLTWNAGAEHFKGYRAEEIVGQHFSRFYPREGLCNEIVGQAFQPDPDSPNPVNLGRDRQPGKADLRIRCKAPKSRPCFSGNELRCRREVPVYLRQRIPQRPLHRRSYRQRIRCLGA